MKNNDKNFNLNGNKTNINLVKDELKRLKIEYEKEIERYKNASRGIIDTEEKFNNISKKINKINYKQLILANKINNDYVENLNTYKLEQNIKLTLLSLFGFSFPNQEPFYFSSSEELIAQLSLSKDFLFNLALTKNSEYETIKSSYDFLDKRMLILRPIYDYMKLNFDIVNLMLKREKIFEENKNWIQKKDYSLINVKKFEKEIKEKYSNMKNKIKIKNINKNPLLEKNNVNTTEKDFDELLNDSHLLSIKDFDDISGKSLMMSMDNDNNTFGIFNEEEINKFDNDINISDEENKNTIKEKNGQNQLIEVVKYKDISNNIFTEEEEEKDINNIVHNKNQVIIKKYRNSRFYNKKVKDILKIENSVDDSGCCASCT